jgi:structural maintenance of chromosome 2
MRAQNQQDLIYKRGQAGITKASVTIVFDNSDRENSPPGMENYAQITVTRQVRSIITRLPALNVSLQIALPNISKYLLNGHKAQQNIIQTIFQSVQLNINNPNFLIMQGRITKVRLTFYFISSHIRSSITLIGPQHASKRDSRHGRRGRRHAHV